MPHATVGRVALARGPLPVRLDPAGPAAARPPTAAGVTPLGRPFWVREGIGSLEWSPARPGRRAAEPGGDAPRRRARPRPGPARRTAGRLDHPGRLGRCSPAACCWWSWRGAAPAAPAPARARWSSWSSRTRCRCSPAGSGSPRSAGSARSRPRRWRPARSLPAGGSSRRSAPARVSGPGRRSAPMPARPATLADLDPPVPTTRPARRTAARSGLAAGRPGGAPDGAAPADPVDQHGEVALRAADAEGHPHRGIGATRETLEVVETRLAPIAATREICPFGATSPVRPVLATRIGSAASSSRLSSTYALRSRKLDRVVGADRGDAPVLERHHAVDDHDGGAHREPGQPAPPALLARVRSAPSAASTSTTTAGMNQ